MPHALRVVNVFAEERHGGNPLAVVLDAGDLSPQLMQEIACEMNLSETTFVRGPPLADGSHPVRIFTPVQELPFAGHPTLGTAWVLRDEAGAGAGDRVHLELGVGRVPVRFEPDGGAGEIAWLTAPPVELGPTCAPERIAAALGLAAGDFATKAPVQRLSAGFAVVGAPLRDRGALRRARLQLEPFEALAQDGFPPFVYLFCEETDHPANDFCARFLFDAKGPREDPATGSATAMFGAYLLEHDWFGRSELSLSIEQGQEIARPSLLRLRARASGGERRIEVGGRVYPSVRGELL